MDNNKKMSLKVLILIIVSILFLNICMSRLANAEHMKVDPLNPNINEKNNLVIEKSPEKLGYEVNIFGNSRMKIIDKTKASKTANAYKFEDLEKYKYSRFEDNYSSKMVEITSPTATDKVVVTYNYVGKYNHSAVGATVTYTDFTYAKVPSANYVQGILELSESLFSGYWYCNLSSMNVVYQFFDANTKKPIDIDNDVIVSVNSLNLYEFAQYLEKTDENNVYTTTDSFVNEQADPYKANRKVWTGTNKELDNYDQLGENGFTKGTISFQINDNLFTIRVGKDANQHKWGVWNSLSSANFNVNPLSPIKSITDDEVDVTRNELNVPYLNQEFTYNVKQVVGTLGVNLLEKYKSMIFTDVLPKEVNFVSAELVSQDGKKVEFPGKINYNEKTNTVTFEASQDFLQKVMQYNGENYSLAVHVKVNEHAKEGSSFKNTASVEINDKSKETNEVETTTPVMPRLSKKILVGDQEKERQDAKVNDIVTFKVISGLGNSKNLRSVVVEDALENVFSFQKITVNSNGKDITTEGDTKLENGVVSWSAIDPASLVGQKLESYIEVKVNDANNFSEFINAKTEKIELPNVAKLIVNEENFNSNKVLVTPPTKESTTIFKQIKKLDGSDVDSVLLKKGEVIVYDISYNFADKQFSELQLVDDLEDVFQITKVNIQSANKDITDEGDLAIDKEFQKVIWVAKEPKRWSGEEIKVLISATLSKDASLEKYTFEKNQYKIPNIAQAIVNDKMYKSNTVYANVEKTLGIKEIPKTGTY
ncbi:isopeptide-forming domain-containing fimbrial protein [Listeria monocytogenes]|uniref:isopeptide-forming domain-containing fimbrial protein n=1 Tax=Listeria monocytogenes TaxID=1639 RepID=UPI0011EB3988|nr:isopeptide-forming domain-containing fimbrial protein [Listeria monocytogenes]TYU82858.1 isopeptide-forming domain-containing fimbrial protein [Listeria monocytogenes]